MLASCESFVTGDQLCDGSNKISAEALPAGEVPNVPGGFPQIAKLFDQQVPIDED